MVNDNSKKKKQYTECNVYDINVIIRKKKRQLTDRQGKALDEFIKVFLNKNVLTYLCIGCLIKVMIKV